MQTLGMARHMNEYYRLSVILLALGSLPGCELRKQSIRFGDEICHEYTKVQVRAVVLDESGRLLADGQAAELVGIKILTDELSSDPRIIRVANRMLEASPQYTLLVRNADGRVILIYEQPVYPVCKLNEMWRNTRVYVRATLNELLVYIGAATADATCISVPEPLRSRLNRAQLEVERSKGFVRGGRPTLDDCLRDPRVMYRSDDGWMTPWKREPGIAPRRVGE